MKFSGSQEMAPVCNFHCLLSPR